jgi:roadblock/LC7 domain-containing protein
MFNEPTEQDWTPLQEWMCGAKKTNGKWCRRRKMKKRTRCWRHGGKAKRGIMNPNSGIGLLSQHLPKKLASKVQAAYADPQLLSLRQNVAFVEARWFQLCSRLYSGESGSLWRLLNEYWNDAENAKKEMVELQKKLAAAETEQQSTRIHTQIQECKKIIFESYEKIGKAIKKGNRDESNWKEALDLSRMSAALKQSEQGRLVEMHNVLMAEEAMLIFAKMLEAIETEVADKSARAKLAMRFHELVNIGNGGSASLSVGGNILNTFPASPFMQQPEPQQPLTFNALPPDDTTLQDFCI